jgi:hypothetical protein
MIPMPSAASRFVAYALAATVLELAAACAPIQPASPVGPVAANTARIWFYQDGAPSDGVGVAQIRLNGAPVGLTQTNSSFYRDLPAGHYHVSLDNPVNDINQSADIDIAPGQQAYVKIAVLDNWAMSSGGQRGGGAHTTFYIWPMPATVGSAAVAHLPVFGG